MKRYYILEFVLIILWSCEKEASRVDYSVISGKIENLKGGVIELLNAYEFMF